MWCLWTKWFLSRFEDAGKSLPFWALRHLEHCEDCRSFQRLGRSLEEFSDIALQLQPDEKLNQRISGSLDNMSAVPKQRSNFRSLRWKPAVIGASILFVVAMGIVWLTGPFNQRTSALGGFRDVDISPFQKLLRQVESPYEEEMTYLRQGLESVGTNIKAFFNSRFNE
jgi:hypothetical protein